MEKGKVVSLEDRVPQLKERRRKKANRRLITFLSLFFLLFIVILYFQSPLSRVKSVHITGNQVYEKEHLLSVSGITNNTNIWKIDKEAVKEKIEALPEVREVKIEVKLPNYAYIHIKEWKRIAYLLEDGRFSPVLENGDILQADHEHPPINAPVLAGFSEGELIKKMVAELVNLPRAVFNSISEIHYAPKDTDQYHIYVYMNNGFEVTASLKNFSEKMAYYPSIISHLDPNVKGVIDIEVGGFFQAFDEGREEVSEENEEKEEKEER